MSISKLLCLVVSILLTDLLCNSVEASAGKRVALVIGNAAYKHAGELANPRNDAADLVAALKARGFHTIEGYDLDKSSLDRKLRDFAMALQGAGAGVFFYAGHGLQVAGANYIVPVDAQLMTAAALDFETVRLDLVQRTMEREAQTSIIFLDACRDNPLARNLARAMGTRSAQVGRGLAAVESGVGTLISFSTQPGNVALDGTGRNSPFAAALVEQILTAGNDLSDILIAVRNSVIRTTNGRQVPWEHSALTARFYFSPQASGPAALASSSEQQAEYALWSAVKDSDQRAVIQSYLDKYPNGTFVPLARVLIDQLERADKDKHGLLQLDNTQELVTALQRELQRIGCYRGGIDGVWGPASRSALANFNRHAKSTLPTDAPGEASLSALRKVFARICPDVEPRTAPQAERASVGASGKNCRRETTQECASRVCPPAGRGCGLRSTGICGPQNRKMICN
jgi:hypothetical protein